jgi:hypothetical protein
MDTNIDINLKNDDCIILDLNPICHNCFHSIKIKNISTGKEYTQMFNGLQIAEYYQYKNINIPQHFLEYITSKN